MHIRKTKDGWRVGRTTVQKQEKSMRVCGRRVIANSVLCTKCENWVHGRCAKIKRITTKLAISCFCLRCEIMMEGTIDSIKKLCDKVKTVNKFCCLGISLNDSACCDAAVTARVRLG